MHLKKTLFFLLTAMLIIASAACAAETVPGEPVQMQQALWDEYGILCRVYKEVITPTPAPAENGEEYWEMVDVVLRNPVSFDELAAGSYSIVTAKLLSVEQDKEFFSKRYYDFEIEECIKGDADNQPSVTLALNDFVFGETSTFIVNKDDGYVPPYEIGGRYLLFLGKSQIVIEKTDKTKYFLENNAFSLLSGDELTELMQQTKPHGGQYPKTLGLIKEKIAVILQNPEENGEVLGCEFIESDDMAEIADFAQVIIETKRKDGAIPESSDNFDVYQMEIISIHKGELNKFAEISLSEEKVGSSDGYLLFLVSSEDMSGHYLPASPQGSVIPVSDAERYNEAMEYLYPEEEKQGLFARIGEFIGKLFKYEKEN